MFKVIEFSPGRWWIEWPSTMDSLQYGSAYGASLGLLRDVDEYGITMESPTRESAQMLCDVLNAMRDSGELVLKGLDWRDCAG